MELTYVEKEVNDEFVCFFVDLDDKLQGSYTVWNKQRTAVLSSSCYTDNIKISCLTFNHKNSKIQKKELFDHNGNIISTTTYVYNTVISNSVLLNATTTDANGDKTLVIKYYNSLTNSVKSIVDTSKKNIAHIRTFWVSNNNNEQVLSSEYYTLNDQLHGTVTNYCNNGVVRNTVNYNNGIIVGDKLEFFNDGITRSKITYIDGKQHGKYKVYNKNCATGELYVSSSGEYNNGKCIGIHYEFNIQGHIESEKHYNDNGELHGLSVKFSNNLPRSVLTFRNGLMHGVCKKYSTCGNKHVLQTTTCFIDGNMHGERKLFSITGKLIGHYFILADSTRILAREFLKELGIPYSHVNNLSDEEKFMIALATGNGMLLCDECI